MPGRAGSVLIQTRTTHAAIDSLGKSYEQMEEFNYQTEEVETETNNAFFTNLEEEKRPKRKMLVILQYMDT